MEKKLEWTEHKAPPLPIMHGSSILTDSLYLYGVDFMSTDDVKKYFRRYVQQEGPEDQLVVIWINDSSCVIKFMSAEIATKAYNELKLSEQRQNDALPPLETYIMQKRE